MPGTKLEFVVRGMTPVPKGNLQAFIVRAPGTKTGWRAVLTDVKSDELKAWEKLIHAAAAPAMAARQLVKLVDHPLELHLVFWLVRPRGDYNPTRGHLLGNARTEPWVKPDFDKLTRAVADSLTDFVIDDDSRVCRAVVEKRYVDNAAQAGVAVRVIARAATIREANQCALSNS
jgi:Holliday junction resolvase RusA-like endonuclease